VQKRGLAGSRLPHQRQSLAAAHGQGNTLEYHEVRLAGAVDLGKSFGADRNFIAFCHVRVVDPLLLR
jgi:hypothetical protein